MAPLDSDIDTIVRAALAEDLGRGDVTGELAIPAGTVAEAVVVAKSEAILAGMAVVRACFHALDAGIGFDRPLADGARLVPGTEVVVVRGFARALLAAERTALNFLQRLSGIATRTQEFVAAVAGLPVQILDTRKTTPLLRALEKHAVVVGGGYSHRFGLNDQILLKENHFALAGRPYEAVVRAAVAASHGVVIAEARDVTEALAAVRGGARVVLLDNFHPGAELRAAVDAVRSLAAECSVSVEIEASGGISLTTVRSFAECGVDRISVGALTHSVAAVDLSLLVRGRP